MSITEDLTALVWKLNEVAGTPPHLTIREYGVESIQPGNYHLREENGKVALNQAQRYPCWNVITDYIEPNEMYKFLEEYIAKMLKENGPLPSDEQ